MQYAARYRQITSFYLYAGFLVALSVAFLIALGLSTGAGATTKYVALGDSYASGLGADTNQYQPEHFSEYDPTTTVASQNECYRTVHNAYAQILAQAKGYALTFAACQGAMTADILSRSEFPLQPPQIQAVTPDTGLVSLQIGGNDAQYKNILNCILSSECTTSSQAYQDSLAILQNQLPGRLDAVYAAIKQRAPQAKIVTVDYAPILPQTYLDATLCAPYMSPAELQLARNFETMLNQVVKAGADRAGATYVQTDYPGSPFLGRDWVGLSKNACSPSAGSIAWSLRFLTNGGNVSFHPTAYGQQFYAQVIANYL